MPGYWKQAGDALWRGCKGNGNSVTKLLTLRPSRREIGRALILALWMTIPVPGIAQTAPGIAPISAGIVPVSGGIVPTTGAIVRPPDRLDWKGKLQFHAKRAYGPLALVGMAAYAGFLQEINSPKEWGQGGSAYGERYASTLAWSGIHGALAFGLDTTLHQDPRYYRSDVTGFLVMPGRTCGPGNYTHADRRRRRDAGYLASRQRLRRGFPFQFMVSRPSR